VSALAPTREVTVANSSEPWTQCLMTLLPALGGLRAGPRVCQRFPSTNPLLHVCLWVLATLRPVHWRYRALRQAARAYRASTLTDSQAISLLCASLFCDRDQYGAHCTEHAEELAAHRRLCGGVLFHEWWPGRPAPAARRRSAASRVGLAAAVLGLTSIGQRGSGSIFPVAPSPIDVLRARAHPILEATGARFCATIAAVA
jgi:hypothetical protein